MKPSRFNLVILGLVLLAIISGVECQNPIPTNITASQQYNPLGMPQLPQYAQLQANPIYASTNSLWIQQGQNLTRYVIVPLGSAVTLLAISPTQGSGDFIDARSDGTKNIGHDFRFPCQQPFVPDSTGRHTLTFTNGGQASNPVVVDVISNFYPGYDNYPYNYPGYGNYPYNYGYYGLNPDNYGCYDNYPYYWSDYYWPYVSWCGGYFGGCGDHGRPAHGGEAHHDGKGKGPHDGHDHHK